VEYRIIGCGNAERGDDAAGLLLVRRLRELGVDAHEHSGEGRAPARLLIYGIEGRRFDLGSAPSPEVREAAERLAQSISFSARCRLASCSIGHNCDT
jgi:Ni,Fe-hydrogenase maturation factor